MSWQRAKGSSPHLTPVQRQMAWDAGRASALRELLAEGLRPEEAERWLVAWEALQAVGRDQPDFWRRGSKWIDFERRRDGVR